MTTQGDHDFEDLDVLIASRSLDPKKVKFGGRMWTVRRDFAPEEVVKFWLLTEDRKYSEAYRMLVGDDGPELARIILSLPTEMGMMPARKLYQIAGVLARGETEGESKGESSASSPES